MQRQLIIGLALLMSAPSIAAAMSGGLTTNALCLRLALAVILSYVGVRFITWLIITYASTSSRWAAPPGDQRDDGGS